MIREDACKIALCATGTPLLGQYWAQNSLRSQTKTGRDEELQSNRHIEHAAITGLRNMETNQTPAKSGRGELLKVAYLEASKNPVLRKLGVALGELETMMDLHIKSASWLVADDNFHRELEAYYLEREHLLGLIVGLTPATTPAAQEYLDTSVYVHLSKRIKSLRN
jgi:hypothetical protein